ncbi:MAG TPA: tRNA (N6-isopentenyl adenosine(37)-C2)-methylthiotransferase MiaB, partial [Candidatus Eisenbacteria bacterium]
MPRRIYIETYGCQMNVADSELMLGQFRAAGYERVDQPAEADVILVNTCAIREHAEQRIYGRLGELSRHKHRRPGVILGVAGCMAQHLKGRLLERVSQLDLVVGPDAYRDLPLLIDQAREEPTLATRLSRDETYADLAPARADGVRAWISIMRGCDKFCAFCIVPYVRGRERSLPVGEVVKQIEHAAAEGFKEIVLLGQTVNAYRDEAVDFAELLRRADRIPGIERIRFTSPHPADMTDAAVEAIATCSKVCPQVHLPLQSGSDTVLDRMRRIYTITQYETLVAKLRAAIPKLALTTDIIVGFPGETVEDFEATRSTMRRIRYDAAFVFKYSPRPGARSAEWPETVDEDEKARRISVLIEEQKQTSLEINTASVGSEVEVLVEGPAK